MTTSDTKLDRVLGAKTGRALESALGLSTVGDLLRHYPRRYAERGELTVDHEVVGLSGVAPAWTRQAQGRADRRLVVDLTS